MPYFRNNFPKILVKVKDTVVSMVDIIRNIRFSSNLKETQTLYENYTWKEGDRLDKISSQKYDDPYQYWSVAKLNDISDPLIDLPKSGSTFDNWVQFKYPGRQWYIGEQQTVRMYEMINQYDPQGIVPGVYMGDTFSTIGRPRNLKGTTAVAEYTTTGADTFEIGVGWPLARPAYPLDRKTNKPKYGGVPWFFGAAFNPTVGMVLMVGMDGNTPQSLPINLLTFPLTKQIANTVRIFKVVRVETSTGLFWVQEEDFNGEPISGLLLNDLITDTSRMGIKMLWAAEIYEHHTNVGGIFVKIPDIAPKITADTSTPNTLVGARFWIADDFMQTDSRQIRQGFVFKEIRQPINAVIGFSDTGVTTGTAANTSQPLAISQTSFVSRWITGWYGPFPSNITLQTVLEKEKKSNEQYRNIKVLSQSTQEVVKQLFEKEIK